jgi:hypothetical protein
MHGFEQSWFQEEVTGSKEKSPPQPDLVEYTNLQPEMTLRINDYW